ncbi:hypothetical protein BHE74_00009000 [Ensete ventricosum]|nr:hypothetical protein GW17_00002327 [Ensete ventricosum]RWW82556.1 hypothetical protein BHE74_00009000 [Ensete ventricosum]RZS08086.1 hypothetical protein BHM03_00039027 [Ensete ventricosum]
MNFLFRRSSSVAASASRRALAALVSSESSILPPSFASASLVPFYRSAQQLEFCGPRRREIHFSAGPLGFRATDVACAEYAVDDYCEDDRRSPERGDERLEIAKLGISQDIVTQLANKGITKLFPIQVLKCPQLSCESNPLAMVLAPTRELARQVEKEFKESSKLYTLCVYGGSPISQQMRALNSGVDVVVGTPGRIIDLLNRGALNLSEIQFVVLDEADQMLNVGFAEDVERILEKMPPKRQTMMFSATMPTWIQKLTRKYLKDPVNIDLVSMTIQFSFR